MKIRIRKTLIIIAVVSLVFLCSAETSIGSFGFNIPQTSLSSTSRSWTAHVGASTNDVFIRTSASVYNQGAEDTYYKVALTYLGPGSSQVKANGTSYRRNMYSYSFTSGSSYSGCAWRVDTTLMTEVVNGQVLIRK